MKSVTAYAPVLEKIFLIGLALGGVLIVLRVQPFDVTVTSVSLFGLGAAYFLSAYRPIELPENERESAGMKDLLQYGILPKVLWISSAVSVIALALLVLDSEARGYRQMFLIGGTTIGIGLAIVVGMAATGALRIRSLMSVLFRAAILLAVDIYFLLR